MPDIIDAGTLSALIGLIYDCAIDPGMWPRALEAIRLELGMHNGSLDLFGLPDGVTLLNYMANIPEPWASTMALYTPDNTAMWGAENIATLPFEEPVVLSWQTNLPGDYRTNPMYTQWAQPQGVCDIVAIFLARDARSFGTIGFGRHIDAPPIDERTVAVARLLVPHAQRAATINRMLDLAALRDATFEVLFDTMGAPVLVVDADLKTVHANRAGRGLLGQDGVLRSRAGTLSSADRMVQHALTSAVADATGNIAAIGRKGLGIPLARGEGPAGALHVLPLRPDHPGGRRLAAIFVAEAGAAPAAPASMVAALFGLTPTESAVFEQVATGCDVPGAAGRLGIAQSTVRTHLLRIYDKTGVRRQAELVRLSASLAAPVGNT